MDPWKRAFIVQALHIATDTACGYFWPCPFQNLICIFIHIYKFLKDNNLISFYGDVKIKSWKRKRKNIKPHATIDKHRVWMSK